jgi:NAD(P)H-hydrate epimerase
MKILSAQQIKQWDAYTIEHEPITSIDLMERAATACTKWLIENHLTKNDVRIFCGKGNNGGDGLAIARLSMSKNIHPIIYILETDRKGSDDFETNLYRLQVLNAAIFFIQNENDFPNIQNEDVIIDALFGAGLNRPLQGIVAALVNHINQSQVNIIAIDIPSGMYADESSKDNTIVKALHTLTFQQLKLCFLVAENADFFGEVHVLDIRLHPDFLATIDTAFELLSKEKIVSLIIPRTNFSHKGTYGHALLVAGNEGKMGAAILAAKACLRTGVGLLTVSSLKDTMSIIQVAVPEAMAVTRTKDIDEIEKYATIGIGPGLGIDNNAQQLLLAILNKHKEPMLIDADALNILSLNKNWLDKIHVNSILTPHPKEFERLVGVCANDFERMNKAIELSKKHPLIIVLKGHRTLIAANGKGYFNTTGNAGMAKGGSGDTLSGMLTALLAQKYNSLDAALIGVYLHGLAGDIALQHQSMESMLPSDMIECIGKAFITAKE